MVNVKEDLTGQKFGKLTVVKQIEDYIIPSGGHYAQWLCLCECGNEIKARGAALKFGKVKSCGCYRSWEDLTGKIFGRLTVIARTEDYISPKGVRMPQWQCLCECGNTCIVTSNNLKKKKGTRSCGCLQKEIVSTIAKNTLHKTPVWDMSNDFGIGYLTNTGNPFYFDKEDHQLIQDYAWYEHITKEGHHDVRAWSGDEQKVILLHQLITGKKYMDHRNLNPLDNRKNNLREATPSQQIQNHPKRSTNTSGFIGVRFCKNIKKWQGRIVINYKEVNLGYFTDKEDAIKARLQAEAQYFKDFAPQRHLFEEYGIKYDPEDKIKGGDSNE